VRCHIADFELPLFLHVMDNGIHCGHGSGWRGGKCSRSRASHTPTPTLTVFVGNFE
jgi:hypothetical protein